MRRPHHDGAADPVTPAIAGRLPVMAASPGRVPLLERSSTRLLKIGAGLSAIFVVVPAIGLAVAMVVLAVWGTWHDGEGAMTIDAQLTFLAVAVLAVAFATACVALLRRSLRRGWIALALVGIGGLACIVAGLEGIAAATGTDNLITALSWGVGTTGIVLTLGSALGMVSRARPRGVP
jgi:hypothetical protein